MTFSESKRGNCPERYRCGLLSRMGTDLEEFLKRKDKTMKVEARVEKEPGEKNFSCYMHIDSLKAAVLGTGSSAKAAIKDMLNGWHDEVAELSAQGKEVPNLDIKYKFDVGSLFNYYDFINVAGISREIGVSSSVMRQYVIGIRKPSPARKKEIVSGIKSLATKMQTAEIY
jgi:hypothetical protein